jgi:preprotein translocase subunit SecD
VPPPPTPPDQPLRTCDVTKTAVYDLAPEDLRIQLTDVDAFLNPLTGKQMVQITMTNESTADFARYTAAHLNQQVAFVRSGIVVWGPKITEPIDGQVLQLSGEVTAEQAKEIARMLRDEA